MTGAKDESAARNERDPVQKALEVLAYIVNEGRRAGGVREIGLELGMTPSASHRALGSLTRAGYLERTAESRYALSLDFYRLARAATVSFPIDEIALPAMRALERRTNESVYLVLYDRIRKQAIVAAKVECRHPIRHVVETMTWSSVFDWAAGMTIFAFLDATERALLLQQAGRETTEFDTLVARLRQEGSAILHPPGVDDAWAVAAPIGRDKGLVGVVSVPVPSSRFTGEARQRLLLEVTACSARLESLLMNGSVGELSS